MNTWVFYGQRLEVKVKFVQPYFLFYVVLFINFKRSYIKRVLFALYIFICFTFEFSWV